MEGFNRHKKQTPSELKAKVLEPTTIEMKAPASYSHLDAVDPDLEESEKPLKAKVYLQDPHHLNQYLVFSNPYLEKDQQK